MPLNSMTGFARADGHAGRYSWAWEARSVNGKGLELRIRLPQGLEALDAGVRERLQKRFTRGNIQASLQLARDDSDLNLKINETVLQTVLKSLEDLSSRIEAAPPTLDGILNLKGILEVSEAEDSEDELTARNEAILTSLDQCLDDLATRRRQEGEFLENLLTQTMAEFADLVAKSRTAADGQSAQVADRLRAQLKDLLADTSIVSEDRLAQEIALLAAKADVREELDRLDAHIVSFRTLLSENKANGRKMDFLMQEFNREANTLCSKSTDVGLTALGLDLKALIGQCREQVQNIE